MLRPHLVRIPARLWTTASPAWRIRSLSTSAPARPRRRRLLPALLLLGLAPVGYTIHLDSAPLDSPAASDDTSDLSLAALIRTYAVYSMCSIPALVDNAPWMLDLATIPGVRWFAETFVRATRLQFVGGDTAQDSIPVLQRLRAANKGALLVYSVEVDEKAASREHGASTPTSPHKRIVDEMLLSIDVAADFEDTLGTKQDRKTWVAIKLSALLPDAHALARLSAHLVATRPAPYSSLQCPDAIPFPGCAHPADLTVLATTNAAPTNHLTPTDLAALHALYQSLRLICARAHTRGVRVTVDAEYSWYQPAIDAFVGALMREFNRPSGSASGVQQPLVYGTYQAYLRRTPAQLVRELRDAREGGYALGVKLLYGMCDDLTAHLVARTQAQGTGGSGSPLVLKYLPYGALAEVMPYLARRAVENRGVLGEASGERQGGAKGERRRAAREVRRRVRAALGWGNGHPMNLD
ncbi:hypothetical protein DXG03_005078 [Asterophora parasitica]|uniref:Proline dehydrogenase n=1 Tax=Asterophora parasitica TaxID=117018 RepID=A0A9P7KB59_9AGAR|nr:hypothetical protein DXG03_005078 [Asterophora parasitica]